MPTAPSHSGTRSWRAAQSYGITPAGIWALDIARIEAGLVMLDVDYYSAHHALHRGPEVVPR